MLHTTSLQYCYICQRPGGDWCVLLYHLDGGGGMKPPELALLAALDGPNPSSFCKL